MDYNPSQAVAIAIIGGADGPTSIYIAGISARGLVLVALLFAIVLGLSVFGLIRGIRKRRKAKVIFFALVSALLLSVIFVHVASGIYQYVLLKRAAPYIESEAGSNFSETDGALGLSVATENYDYFFAENKIISVEDNWID